jgi:hypothetical protein|tara:strand:+ start:5351 stop:5803 length:453 start_codon:yes stop_codon:yes gene_type:complete
MSSKIFDALDKTFETVTQAKEVHTPIVVTDDKDAALENDFAESRAALKRAMTYAESAVQSSLEVAQNSDNPRAYEVAIQAIKVMSDQAKDVMDIQTSKQRIDKVDGKNASQIGTQNNIVFNGSTSDLLKAIKIEADARDVIEHESTNTTD